LPKGEKKKDAFSKGEKIPIVVAGKKFGSRIKSSIELEGVGRGKNEEGVFSSSNSGKKRGKGGSGEKARLCDTIQVVTLYLA